MTDLDIVVSPEPFTPRVARLALPAMGQTIGGILAVAVQNDMISLADVPRVVVYIDGEALPAVTNEERRAAMRYVPVEGQIINVAVEPAMGGGREDNKALQTVLQLALIAATIAISVVAGPWAAAAFAIGGNLVISALTTIKQEKLQDANDRRALQGASNQYRPRSAMPLILGLQRVGFDLAAPPYTQVIGDDVWLNIAFGVHYGPCWVGNVKIGETAIEDYPEEDVLIEYFLTPGPRASTIYPGSVIEQGFQDKLEKGGDWEVHTTTTDGTRLNIDVTFPQGLRFNKDNGKILQQEVQGRIEYSPAGADNWSAAPIPVFHDRLGNVLPQGEWYVQARTNDPVRRTFEWAVAEGQYDVRVKRWDPDNDDPDTVSDETYWTALRSIRDEPPITDETLAVIFFRIRSSGDLSGTLPLITGDVEPIVPVWDGDSWDTEARSSNAAALVRWVLTGPASSRAMDDGEFHASLEDTFDLIELKGWRGGVKIIEDKSQKDAMIALGQAGRFSTYWNGSKLCFVPDWVREAPRQVFAGRNAAGYRYRRSFPEPLHAVLIEFLNVDEDTQADELWVYADGYDKTNATLFETVRIDFAITGARAFQEGRVYLAKRLLQVELHEWTAGADSIATTYGDRVLVRHNSTLYGLADARVTFRRFTGGLVSSIRLDEEVVMEAGKSYGIDIRRADGVLRGVAVQTVAGTTRDLTFAVPRATDQAPSKGDLVVFGETEVITEDLEIIDVAPADDMTATFRGIKYLATEIQAAIDGVIPDLPTTIKPRTSAPKPRVLAPDYALPEGLVVSVTLPAWNGAAVAGYGARWRETYTDPDTGAQVSPWRSLGTFPLDTSTISTGPISGAQTEPGEANDVTVDMEVWSILKSGERSEATRVDDVPVVAPVAAPTGFSVEGLAREAPDGSSHPAIAVAADPIIAGDIQDLEVQIKKTGASDTTYRDATGSPFSARNPVGDVTGVLGGQGYTLRARWRTASNWPSAWTDPETAVIPIGALVSYASHTVGGLTGEELLAALAAVTAEAAAATGRLQDLITESRGTAGDLAKTLLGAILDRRDQDERLRVRTLTGKVPLGAFVEQKALLTATLIYNQNLMGVRSVDATAWELNEQTLKLENGDSLAQRFTLLYAGTADAMAAISNEATARANAITSEANLRITLASTVAANAATAATGLSTLTTNLTSLATEFHLLGAWNGAHTAFVLDMTRAEVSPGVSFASRLSSIDAATSNAAAAVVAEASARSSQDLALASAYSGLAATVSGNYGTLNAAIVNEGNVRASADTANANSISSVSTTVNGHTASINTQQTSINGLNAQYVLNVSAGRIAGIRLAAGGGSSSALFYADQIGFTNGASDFFPLSIVGSIVRATNLEVDHLKAGTVETDDMSVGAVSGIVAGAIYTGSNVMDSDVLVAEAYQTTTDGKVIILFYCDVGNSGPNSGVLCTLKCDGSYVDTYSAIIPGSFTSPAIGFSLVTPGAGSHHYTVEAHRTPGSGSGMTAQVGKLFAIEMKKAA